MPVVEPGALHGLVRNVEAERLDEVQPRTGRGAGARDVAAILRDLRLNEHDIQHGTIPPFSESLLIIPLKVYEINHKTHFL